MELEFVECSVCAAKPGSPDLCESCLTNRRTIEHLKEQIDMQKKPAEAVQCDFNTLSEKTNHIYHEIKSIGCELRVEAKNALNDDNQSQAVAALYALDYINKILRGFEKRNEEFI